MYAETIEKLHPTFTPPPEFIFRMTDEIHTSLVAYYDSWS